jgi:anhydro-N-acetylmuramic acid kinase
VAARRTGSRKSRSDLYIGLMSGTSLDGVDAALAGFGSARPQPLAHSYVPFPDAFKRQLGELCVSGPDELDRAGIAQQQLARLYAQAVDHLLTAAKVSRRAVRAIGAHGQTIRHRPEQGYTVQLNAPALLAELSGIDVVADFRSRDVAAGGQGAPLVCGFHAEVFGDGAPRAVVNIGGISNVTALPAGDDPIIGFDCGPGNLLLDAWTQRHFDAPFDRGGALAAGTAHDATLLAALLNDPYFAAAPPKSTGREYFTLDWFARVGGEGVNSRVGLATLTRLTAAAIGRSIEAWAPRSRDVVVCGGGARNPTLLRALAEESGGRAVATTATFGIEPEQVEALAFAWLARAYIERRQGNVPSVTGARGGRVLGALYPA